jgi:predicted nucleic acid-binding protein
MVVVDTSSWIEMLRESGRGEVRERVIGHLRNGEARLVPMVRLELWNGARGAYEKKVLRELERTVPELDMSAAVWDQAFDFARRARAAGLTAPTTDILIAACARHHGADIEAADAHFSELAGI